MVGLAEHRVVRDGHHTYLSTACLHAVLDGRVELHRYCQTGGTRWDGGTKTAATCKWCESRCTCVCHYGDAAELERQRVAIREQYGRHGVVHAADGGCRRCPLAASDPIHDERGTR